MKRIPKQFRIFAHTITVEVVPKSRWKSVVADVTEQEDDDCVGLFSSERNAIYVLKQSKSQTMHSLWHEITHAILYYLNHKLYSNEQFVDTVAGCICQVMETAE